MLRGYPGDHFHQAISARDGMCARRARLVAPDGTGWSLHHVLASCEPDVLTHGLAEAFLSGPWNVDGMVDRSGKLLGRRYRWLRPLARRVLAAFSQATRPRLARLAGFIAEDKGFRRAHAAQSLELHFVRWPAQAMSPAPGPPEEWSLPAITSPAELAAQLDLEPSELDWFADAQSRERTMTVERLRHYRYRWVPKPSGSFRLIEAPKPRLKRIQRWLLDQIIGHIPPHEAAHGFRIGRSITSFVAPHVGRTIVLKMDFRDFFGSITSARVIAIYLAAGYPEPVATLLTGLCTNTAPSWIWHPPGNTDSESPPIPGAWRSRRLYHQPHLPQGAPTSPALANLVAYHLDARLSGLARAAEAVYTRYADDLVFSGGDAFARTIARFPTHVAAIAREEGFTIEHRKTRVMRRAGRQHAAGIVINQKLNVRRDDYDRLKAILHNCARFGPQDQNRGDAVDFRAHLAGRIAHVTQLNAERGERLRRAFERISW